MIYIISTQTFHDIALHSYTEDEESGWLYCLMTFKVDCDEKTYALNIVTSTEGVCYATDFYEQRDGGRLRMITPRISSSTMLHALDRLVASSVFVDAFGSKLVSPIVPTELYVKRSERFVTELGESIPGTYFYAYRLHYDVYKKPGYDHSWWLFGSFYWSKTGSIYELELQLDDTFALTGTALVHVDKPYKRHLLNPQESLNPILAHYRQPLERFIDRSRDDWKKRNLT